MRDQRDKALFSDSLIQLFVERANDLLEEDEFERIPIMLELVGIGLEELAGCEELPRRDRIAATHLANKLGHALIGYPIDAEDTNPTLVRLPRRKGRRSTRPVHADN